MGMDSYRDSTSVGLRLASTLSSDRGQQQSSNQHIFAMIKNIKNLRISWLSPLQDKYY